MIWRIAHLVLLAGSATHPAAALAADPARAGHWPQWRGPDRTNVSAETGLLKEWPEAGPPLAWKVDGLCGGVPPVAVAGGRVYVLGDREGEEVLTALAESDGKKLWTAAVGPTAPGNMSIMRWLSQRTPTVDGDRVYTVTNRGELTCLATADGTVRWRKNYVADFGGQRNNWGYCDFPLVDGDRLVCTPCGPDATLVALDKRTGAMVWKCAVPGAPRSTYGAVVAAEIAGVRQYVQQFDTLVIGVAAADGKRLWSYLPEESKEFSGNMHTVLIRGDEVFASSGWDRVGALVRLAATGTEFRVQEAYRRRLAFDPWLGSSVRLGDYVHAANGFCAEWQTGRLAGRVAVPGRAAREFDRTQLLRMTMTCADGRLYHRTANNVVSLTEVKADGTYAKRGEFTAPRGSDEPAWSFPVVAGGRLYLRDQGVLLCYDVRDKAARRRRPDVIFVPTPQDVVEQMLELAGVTKKDVVADLGCGDGRIVVTAAKRYGCRAVGYELDPECVRLALKNVKAEGVEGLVRIEGEDLFKADLRGVTVVTLYLGPAMNARLIPQLETLPRGARIVSHAFPMPGVTPDRVMEVKSAEDDVVRKLYLWTTPLKKQP
jgi:outer membrane protein assembly factor BamB